MNIDNCNHENKIMKDESLICTNCGLILDELIILDEEYNRQYDKKISREYNHLNEGSILKTSNKKFSRIKTIQRRSLDIHLLNFKNELSKVNSIFQLSEENKYKIIDIYKHDIRPFIKKFSKYLPLVVTALLFFYRNQKIPVRLDFIIRELNKNCYSIKARNVLNVIKMIPIEIRKMYKRPTVRQSIEYCLLKTFDYISLNKTHLLTEYEKNALYEKIKNEIIEHYENQVKMIKENNSNINIYIGALIYEKLKHKKLITQVELEQLFNFTQCSLRNARQRFRIS